MKLATLKNGTRDGALVVVTTDLRQYLPANLVGVRSLQAALDDWVTWAPKLAELAKQLNAGTNTPANHTPLPSTLHTAWRRCRARISRR